MEHAWKFCVLLIFVIYTGCKAIENGPCTWRLYEPGQYTYCHITDIHEASCQNYVNYTLKACKDEEQNYEWVENYNYSLKINVKNPREADLFLVDLQKIVVLVLEDSDLTAIPEDVYKMNRLKELTIFNKINKVNFFKFLTMSSLEKVKLSHNQIALIEMDDVSNSNSVIKDIDLSYNLIEAIPNNFVKPMSKLERLNLSHNKISSIGLQAFNGINNLLALDISNNELHEIGNVFSKLPKLRELSLSNNHLINLPDSNLENLISLEILNVSSNMIERITLLTFEGLALLKKLDISNNRLTKIGYAFAALSNLRELNISNNTITKILDLHFITLTNLEILDASSNHISAIETDAFQTLTKLQTLDLGHNKIESIPKLMFASNTKLTKLSLLDNQIEAIEPNSFKGKHINEFYIQNNKLAGPVKTGTFSGIDDPELDLSFGNITSIGNEAFAFMSHLNYLNLSTNAINKISYLSFSSLVSLHVLDLSYNQLQELNFESESLRNLYKLYAHHNKIENIITNVFENFVSLQELDLSYNDIKAIEPHQFLNKLTYLDLSSNTEMKIIGDPFQSKTELNRLSLQNVKTDITFENCSVSVRVLELQSCGIVDLNIVYVYNVQNMIHLNLSMNKIAIIDNNTFKTMPSLVNLDLSLNKITFIQPGSFLQTRALNVLNLYGNNLPSVQYGVFDGLDVLSDLNLAKNELRRYDIKVKPVIAKLSLDDNYITNFNFKELFTTATSELSIGGNQIPCDVFAELKYSNYSEKFRQIVTAKRLNYYTENINGITCQNVPIDTSIASVTQNPVVLMSPIVTLLKSSLDQISTSLQTIGENTHKTETSLKDLIESSKSFLTANNEKLTNITQQLAEIKNFINQNESGNEYLPLADLNVASTPSDEVNLELLKYND